jgi:hypothetical protein
LAKSIISRPLDGKFEGFDAILGSVEPIIEPTGGKNPDASRFVSVMTFRRPF